jgi:XTP/dITP diphosphohydrolase
LIPKLLLATRNPGKVREYSLLLQDAPFQLTSLTAEGIDEEVVESGDTLERNAELKALHYASKDEYLVVADDSGLEVDALGGLPGPISARFAGEGASDSDRIARLLRELEGLPWEKRTARFRCVIAIARMNRVVQLCQGECRGIIRVEPRGRQGFGYDPVFYLPELDKTMAELSIEEKNRLSHRGKAARRALEVLRGIRREMAQ